MLTKEMSDKEFSIRKKEVLAQDDVIIAHAFRRKSEAIEVIT